MQPQDICTCNDPFSMACPLHTNLDSDSSKTNVAMRQKKREVSSNLAKDGEKTISSFQGPLCDCQVMNKALAIESRFTQYTLFQEKFLKSLPSRTQNPSNMATNQTKRKK